MGRPSKNYELCQKVLKKEAIDYSNYTHKELISCIEQLANMYNELSEISISTAKLNSIKTALEKQVSRISELISQ